jgi:hypothetical protein
VKASTASGCSVALMMRSTSCMHHHRTGPWKPATARSEALLNGGRACRPTPLECCDDLQKTLSHFIVGAVQMVICTHRHPIVADLSPFCQNSHSVNHFMHKHQISACACLFIPASFKCQWPQNASKSKPHACWLLVA